MRPTISIVLILCLVFFVGCETTSPDGEKKSDKSSETTSEEETTSEKPEKSREDESPSGNDSDWC